MLKKQELRVERTFEVIDTFPVEHAHPCFHSRLATAQVVDDIPQLFRRFWLLLHVYSVETVGGRWEGKDELAATKTTSASCSHIFLDAEAKKCLWLCNRCLIVKIPSCLVLLSNPDHDWQIFLARSLEICLNWLWWPTRSKLRTSDLDTSFSPPVLVFKLSTKDSNTILNINVD